MKANRLKLSIAGALVLCSMGAWGASRIGGGKLSNDEIGFLSVVPRELSFNQIVLPDGSFRLSGRTWYPPGSLRPERQNVRISLLSQTHPVLQDLDVRVQFRRFFLERDWVRLQVSQPCVEAFEKITPRTRNLVLSWGGSRGIFLIGTDSADIQSGLQAITQHLELDPGACAWK